MGGYVISEVHVTTRPIAIVRDRARPANLVEKILGQSSLVWDFLKSGKCNTKSTGHNVVVYHGCGTDDGLAGEFTIEVGAQVVAPFIASGQVECSNTPGGIVATTIHIGPYARLNEAHHAIRDWCRQNNRPITGTNWEVYGH